MPRPKKTDSPTEVKAEPAVVEKVRKPRKKKEVTEVAEKPEPDKTEPKTSEKKKRVMTEKQLQALLKGRESLRLKREQAKAK